MGAVPFKRAPVTVALTDPLTGPGRGFRGCEGGPTPRDMSQTGPHNALIIVRHVPCANTFRATLAQSQLRVQTCLWSRVPLCRPVPPIFRRA